MHHASGAWHSFSRCQFRDSPLCPEFPTTWAHFWEALSIIFRETQFPELGPQPTSVSPQRSVLSSWGLPGPRGEDLGGSHAEVSLVSWLPGGLRNSLRRPNSAYHGC